MYGNFRSQEEYDAYMEAVAAGFSSATGYNDYDSDELVAATGSLGVAPKVFRPTVVRPPVGMPPAPRGVDPFMAQLANTLALQGKAIEKLLKNCEGNDGDCAVDNTNVIALTITNTALADREFFLSKYFITGGDGHMLEGTFNDANGNPGLSATGLSNKIEFITGIIRYAPHMIEQIKIDTNDVRAFSYPITARRITVNYQELGKRTYSLDGVAQKGDFNYDKQRVACTRGLILGSDQEVMWKLPAAKSATEPVVVTLKFYIKASANLTRPLGGAQ